MQHRPRPRSNPKTPATAAQMNWQLPIVSPQPRRESRRGQDPARDSQRVPPPAPPSTAPSHWMLQLLVIAVQTRSKGQDVSIRADLRAKVRRTNRVPTPCWRICLCLLQSAMALSFVAPKNTRPPEQVLSALMVGMRATRAATRRATPSIPSRTKQSHAQPCAHQNQPSLAHLTPHALRQVPLQAMLLFNRTSPFHRALCQYPRLQLLRSTLQWSTSRMTISTQ